MKRIFPLTILLVMLFPFLGFSQSNVIINDNDTVYTYTQQMPEFPGGSAELQNYIVKNLQYPREEQDNGVQGTVYVDFTVEKNGSISNVHAIREVQCGPGLTKAAIQVIQEMPKWTPGNLEGRPVSVSVIQPINFSLEEDYGKFGRQLSSKDEGNVWVCNPGTLPIFIGGDSALQDYVSSLFTLTKKETKNCDGYQMAFKLVIDTDGTVCDVNIISIVREENVVPQIASLLIGMPKWKAGSTTFEKVRVRMQGTLTISQSANNWKIYFRQPFEQKQLDFHIAPAVLPKNETVMPIYIGGDSALQLFLKKNTVYPPALKKTGGQQKIIVSVIVENDGSISYPSIYGEPICAQEFKDEALRVVGTMPKWAPGTINGRAARFVVKVEVNFVP